MKKIFLLISLVTIIFLTHNINVFASSKDTYKFETKPLPYAYDALEPYISKETMTLHHDKHYQAYVDKLNAAIEKYPKYQKCTLYDLLTNLESLPEEISIIVKNNAGGAYNHELFFNNLSKEKSEPSSELKAAIESDFGSYDNFKTEFKDKSSNLFGSGWIWLVADCNNKLSIITTPNQDNPISCDLKPIIGLDLWEHAYYLDYQNNKGKYIDNYFNVINWNKALENYKTKINK